MTPSSRQPAWLSFRPPALSQDEVRAAALDALRPTLTWCLKLLIAGPTTVAAPPLSSSEPPLSSSEPPLSSSEPPPLTSGLGTAGTTAAAAARGEVQEVLAVAAHGAVQEVMAAQGVIGPLRERWCEWLSWATAALEDAGIAAN